GLQILVTEELGADRRLRFDDQQGQARRDFMSLAARHPRAHAGGGSPAALARDKLPDAALPADELALEGQSCGLGQDDIVSLQRHSESPHPIEAQFQANGPIICRSLWKNSCT